MMPQSWQASFCLGPTLDGLQASLPSSEPFAGGVFEDVLSICNMEMKLLKSMQLGFCKQGHKQELKKMQLSIHNLMRLGMMSCNLCQT